MMSRVLGFIIVFVAQLVVLAWVRGAQDGVEVIGLGQMMTISASMTFGVVLACMRGSNNDR